jgi:hypothetical protein
MGPIVWLNRRSLHWKFFRKAHRSCVERLTQEADQPDACGHNARHGHTSRNMQSRQFHYQGSNRTARNPARTTVMQIELA